MLAALIFSSKTYTEISCYWHGDNNLSQIMFSITIDLGHQLLPFAILTGPCARITSQLEFFAM